jgi:transposase-like protein
MKVEFVAWRTWDLSHVHLGYLFLDGSHVKFHPGSLAEPVLCAWGITTEGAPELIGDCEVVLAKSLRQRCLIHLIHRGAMSSPMCPRSPSPS